VQGYGGNVRAFNVRIGAPFGGFPLRLPPTAQRIRFSEKSTVPGLSPLLLPPPFFCPFFSSLYMFTSTRRKRTMIPKLADFRSFSLITCPFFPLCVIACFLFCPFENERPLEFLFAEYEPVLLFRSLSVISKPFFSLCVVSFLLPCSVAFGFSPPLILFSTLDFLPREFES